MNSYFQHYCIYNSYFWCAQKTDSNHINRNAAIHCCSETLWQPRNGEKQTPSAENISGRAEVLKITGGIFFWKSKLDPNLNCSVASSRERKGQIGKNNNNNNNNNNAIWINLVLYSNVLLPAQEKFYFLKLGFYIATKI